MYLDENIRRVNSIALGEDARSPIRQRLQELKPILENHFGMTLEGFEPPECLAYSPGDFFTIHVDGGEKARGGDLRRRRVSTVIFLNRESPQPSEGTYGEGKLKLYGLLDGPQWEFLGLPLDAEPGLLIAFPSDQLHEVTPVSHGRRFTVVTWFYGSPEPQAAEGAD